MMAGVLDNYEPVEDRLAKFWAAHPDGRVLTALLQQAPVIIFRAELYRAEDTPGEPWATGHAHQRILDAPPMGSDGPGDAAAAAWTSPFEVCETSALGRALANAGFAPRGARPSREEMQSVRRRELVSHRVEIARLGARVDTLSPAQKHAFGAWKDEQRWSWPWPAAAIVAMHRKLDEFLTADRHADRSTIPGNLTDARATKSCWAAGVVRIDAVATGQDACESTRSAVPSTSEQSDLNESDPTDGNRCSSSAAMRFHERQPALNGPSQCVTPPAMVDLDPVGAELVAARAEDPPAEPAN
jgi:hypothetical protein